MKLSCPLADRQHPDDIYEIRHESQVKWDNKTKKWKPTGDVEGPYFCTHCGYESHELQAFVEQE